MSRGEIVLHSPGQAVFGVVLQDVCRLAEEGNVTYVVPSQKLVPHALRFVSRQNHTIQKNIHVRTFDRFVREWANRENKRALLTDEQQKLLVLMAVERAAKKHGFLYFRHALTQTGWLQAIEEWIGEMKRAGIFEGQLLDTWKNGTQKQKELALIFASYQELLREMGFVDHEEEYREMISQIHNPKMVQKALPERVMLEHFYDLNQLQAHVLEMLVKQGTKVHFHLEYDETRKHLFSEGKRTIEMLQQAGFTIRRKQWESPERIRVASMEQIVTHFLSPSTMIPELKDGSAIEILEAPVQSREVEAVAARIKSLVREEGYRLQEMAIVVANMEGYQETLFSVMERGGIPLAMGKKQKLSENPLIYGILQLLWIVGKGDTDWTPLWQNPYFPWGERAGELLELYRRLGKPVNRREWETRVDQLRHSLHQKQQGTEEERIASLGSLGTRLYRLVERIPLEATVDQFAVILRDLEEQGGFHQGFFQLLEDEEEEVYLLVTRDMKALSAFHEVLDEIGNLAAMAGNAENVIPLHEYAGQLQLMCENKEFVYQPGTKGGVEVVHPSHIRGQLWPCVFVLGLTEGEFPYAIKNDWLLPDEERADLRKQNMNLLTSLELYQGQGYRFFVSTAAARDKLILSYPVTGANGKQSLPSSYVDEVLQLFYEDTVFRRTIPLSEVVPKEYADCVTVEQLMEKVMVDLFSAQVDPDRIPFAHSCVREQLHLLLPRVETEAERYSGDWGAFDGVLQTLEGRQKVKNLLTHHVWSASQLDTLMQCRFAFFAERLLRLSAWEEEDEAMTHLEQGNLLHLILFKFLRQQKRVDWKACKKEDLLSELQSCAHKEMEIFRQSSDRQKTNPVLWQIAEERLLLQLQKFFEVEWQRREKDEMGLQPDWLEVSFGTPVADGEVDERSQKEWISLPIGKRTIRLRGKIDRVDTTEDGRFVVYDYKKGDPPTSEQVRAGTHVQLPLYLWMLQQAFGFDLSKAQGAAYFSQNNRNQGLWRQEALQGAGLSQRIAGKFDPGEWDDMLNRIQEQIIDTLELAENGDFAVNPAIDCPPYCAFRFVCRNSRDRLAAKGSNAEEGGER